MVAICAERSFGYIENRPKDFFGLLGTIAYWGTLSPRARGVAQRTAELLDNVYDAFVLPGVFSSLSDFYKVREWKNAAALVAYFAAAAEFLHTSLKVIDLGKRLPAVQMVATLGDCAYYAIDLYNRRINVNVNSSERFLHTIKDIICLALTLSAILTLAYGQGYAIPWVMHLALDTFYYGADCRLYLLNPAAK